MPTVVVTDFLSEPLDIEREILAGVAEVVAAEATDESTLAGIIDHADALIVYHYISLSAPSIERLQNCRIIVRGGVGFENVDITVARALGIPVANVPDYGTGEVADSAIGMTLSLARGVHFLNSRLRSRAGAWSYTQTKPLYRLRGRTFGIVGLGRIGSAAARRARALGMEVAWYDPYVESTDIEGTRKVTSLPELLECSHIVSLHCPGGDETRGMIGPGEIATMPAGSYLINTARGEIVESAAVLAALASGHLAGAGIDVLPEEPPPEDDPLITAWRDPVHPAHSRLILNPHAAFYCEEGLLDIRRKASHNIRAVLGGEAPVNVVN